MKRSREEDDRGSVAVVWHDMLHVVLVNMARIWTLGVGEVGLAVAVGVVTSLAGTCGLRLWRVL